MQMKKWMKKGIAVAVAGTTVFSLAACSGGGEKKSEDELKIGSDIIKDEVTLRVCPHPKEKCRISSQQ